MLCVTSFPVQIFKLPVRSKFILIIVLSINKVLSTTRPSMASCTLPPPPLVYLWATMYHNKTDCVSFLANLECMKVGLAIPRRNYKIKHFKYPMCNKR